MTAMTEDRRTHRRRDACKIGALTVGGVTRECLVWDLSEGGAQIEIEAEQADLPETFVLAVEGVMPERRCRVTRREGRRIAAAFES